MEIKKESNSSHLIYNCQFEQEAEKQNLFHDR